ncbi:hypothetical protein [uncultured Campylobacter sp.]|nr:hypothetical protein [uncultured Campylobacter sp.]
MSHKTVKTSNELSENTKKMLDNNNILDKNLQSIQTEMNNISNISKELDA